MKESMDTIELDVSATLGRYLKYHIYGSSVSLSPTPATRNTFYIMMAAQRILDFVLSTAFVVKVY